MATLICPVKPGDLNEELRYSLRSWEANLLPGEEKQLIIVGHCPAWLQPDNFIRGNVSKSMDRVVFENVLLGAEYALEQGVEEVIVMNDDMICLDPVTDVPKVRRNISLREHASLAGEVSWWGRSLRATLSLSEVWGVEDPQSYEVHRPLVADAARLTRALLSAAEDMSKHDALKDLLHPQWRTVYGIAFDGLDDQHLPVRDVKVSGTKTPVIGSPWLSTDDSSWRFLGAAIRKRFQNPSRWETQ